MNKIIITSGQAGLDYWNNMFDQFINTYYKENMLVVIYRTSKDKIKTKVLEKSKAIKLARRKNLVGIYFLGEEISHMI